MIEYILYGFAYFNVFSSSVPGNCQIQPATICKITMSTSNCPHGFESTSSFQKKTLLQNVVLSTDSYPCVCIKIVSKFSSGIENNISVYPYIDACYFFLISTCM